MDKKQQILATALRLFVEYGFHGTPTAKVAQEAGVANGTLFHHYKTKDDLVIALYISIKDELEASLTAITHDSDFITPKFKTIFITLNWALINKDKFYYLRQFELSPHLIKLPADATPTILDRLIAEGIKRKILRTQPADLLLSLYDGHLWGTYRYISNADLEPPKQNIMIAELYEIVWDMIKYKG